jgi:hypothetical protein
MGLPSNSSFVERLDGIRPAECCSSITEWKQDWYQPTYVGPRYGAKHKILFIGLDRGSGVGRCHSVGSWQREVYHGKRNGDPLNPHFNGCVQTAAAILRMPCVGSCSGFCINKDPQECVLSYFAQTNCVKCAPPGKKEMAFQNTDRISRCLGSNIFREIEVLQPDVIVLQGKNLRSGHIHNDFGEQLKNGGWGDSLSTDDTSVKLIRWERRTLADRWPSILLELRHPSARGKFTWKNQWERDVLPTIPKVHTLLERP